MKSHPRLWAFCAALALVAGIGASTTGRAATDPLPPGPPPGVVIAQTPSPDDRFIGSPSLVILPDGGYLAAHDWFGSGAVSPISTELYRSADRGVTWTKVGSVPYLHFATLFAAGGDVYLLGTSTNRSPGYISIHRSGDRGSTWTSAAGATTGRLFFPPSGGSFACAPTPVLVSGGRIWKSFTETPDVNLPGNTGLRAMMISAPASADLLNASSWTRTNSVAFDPAWLNAYRPGWLEGNAVQAPDGSVVNILRTDSFRGDDATCALGGAAAGSPRYELAALVRTPSVSSSSFSPSSDGWLHLPGGSSKFTIRFHPGSARYWSIINKITGDASYCTTTFSFSPPMQRNVLSLISSSDLRTWTEHCRLLRWREGETVTQTDRTGFQYVDWQFDGDDLAYVTRTGWGAHRAHDANYLTFHRVSGFRALTMVDSGADLVLPSAPSNLAARSVARVRIELTWADNAFSEDGFRIERSVNGGAFAEIASVGENTTLYTNDNLTEGSTYAYRVRAYRTASGNTAYSKVVSLPAAPDGLTARAEPGMVSLSWSDRATNETKFRIQRAPAGGTYTELAEVGANVAIYADRSLPAAGGYSYRVRASNADGSSAFSNEASLTVSASAPTVLASPQSQVVATGEKAAFTVSFGGVPVPSVQWRRNGAPIAGATQPTCSITAAGVAQTGTYDAILSNASGTAASAAATLRLKQSIDFFPPSEIFFPDGPWALAATASSGLPVMFSVFAGPATAEGNALTWSGPGVASLRAVQPGDSRFAAADSIERDVRALPSFASWRREHFTAAEVVDPTRSGATAVYNGDGIPNLVKYALGLAPAADGSRVLPAISVSGAQGVLAYARPAITGDVSYLVQVADRPGGPWSEAGVDHRRTMAEGGVEHWEARQDIGPDGVIFMRLLLTR